MLPPDTGAKSEVAARLVISGRVQGVGFRWFAAKTAGRLGLTGWASNRPDGLVEVVARGLPGALAELRHALQAGPRLARVDSVEKFDISPDIINTNSFEIR